MIHGPAFYKLLGIPESVAEPTAYHLLGIDPRMVTPALVDSALKERKLRLRQNIPGPQFIPIVSTIERELERAAAILREPHRRQEYNAQLVGEARKKRRQRQSRERRKLVEACRQAVRQMVDADGCLAEKDRGGLAERLARLGLPYQDLRYVLDHVPRPAGEAASPEQERQARDEAMGFFRAAIDLEISRGVLTAGAEQKLTAMAAKFGIGAEVVGREIDQRLEALGARRGTSEDSPLVAQFKVHVLAMFPNGGGSEDERRRLMSLAAAEGLSRHEAERVLDDYLGAPAGAAGIRPEQPFGLSAEPLPILESLAADAARAPALPRPRAPSRPDYFKYTVLLVVPLVLLAVSIIAYQLVTRWPVSGPPEAPSPAGAVPGGEAKALIGLPGLEADRPALLTAAFEALDEPAEVRALFNGADPAARAEALEEAAHLLIAGGTPREQVLVEGLFQTLLHCPPANAPCQNAAVGALVERLRDAAGEGELGRASVYRAVGLLASVLFLRATPGVAVTDSGQMHRFLDQCERAFAQSRKDHPADPANDPRRLAYAAMEGGELTTYGRRADPERFAAVLGELAKVAADPQRPGSQEALSAMLASGGYASYAQATRRAARLALCDVLAETPDERVAAKVRATLVSVMSVDFRDPLRIAALDAPEQRAAVAKALRRAIGEGLEGAMTTRPAVPTAATEPATSGPRPQPPQTPLAQKLRAAWSAGNTHREILTDLAATMLACADRTARFTRGADALSREVLAVAAERDASQRAARLTKGVRLPDAREDTTAAPGPVLPAATVGQLEEDVRSPSQAVRYRAIERLRRLDSAQSAAVLLKRLEELVTQTRIDLPMMNRVLRALVEMNDAQIPSRLARLIQPARSNYAAHRLAITLLEGSGYVDSPHRWRYQLPVNHSAEQRHACAARWKTLAVSAPWGRGQRLAKAIAGPTGAPPAWQADPLTEKLLAAFSHYARLTGLLLKSHRAAGGAEAPALPDLRPDRQKIVGPVDEEQLLEALDLMAAELTRLAREHPNSKKHAVRIDMIHLSAEARSLACETALQRAAARLEEAGLLLEVLVQEADPSGERQQAATRVSQERGRAVAEASNVLAELRENCHQVLALLELLPAAGP